MTSEMTQLRKEDISLYYYLKHTVLEDFIEKEELVPLQYMPEISTDNSYVYEAVTDILPKPTARGRGWVYLNNPSDAIETDSVLVYDATATGTIDNSLWMVDYIDGRVVTSGTCQPVYVTYDWHYVSLVDEWSAVEAADPPVVVIDIHGTDKTGYQLGPGKLATRKVDLHIFASNTAERNDIVETLYDGLYLKSCPMYDLPEGTILDYDGTWYGRRDNMNRLDTLFNRTTVSGILGCGLMFENVTSRHVNLPLLMTRGRTEVMLSDLNAYRSKVSFDMYHYTEY